MRSIILINLMIILSFYMVPFYITYMLRNIPYPKNIGAKVI